MSKVKKKMSREITKKVRKVELSLLCRVCLLIWVYISIKYHPNILNSFGVIEHTQKFVKKLQMNITKRDVELQMEKSQKLTIAIVSTEKVRTRVVRLVRYTY